MLWSTSPACTELETHVSIGWSNAGPAATTSSPLRRRRRDPGHRFLSAALCALLAAREQATAAQQQTAPTARWWPTPRRRPIPRSRKAVQIAGLGSDNLRLIEVDGHSPCGPSRLAAAIAADRPRWPPLRASSAPRSAPPPRPPSIRCRGIGEICRQHGLWLHVDAAMAGTAAICAPSSASFRTAWNWPTATASIRTSGCSPTSTAIASSLPTAAQLIRTLSILPEYLRNQATESGAVIDYRDWQVPLGRRFRALKLWFVIRYYGVEGLQSASAGTCTGRRSSPTGCEDDRVRAGRAGHAQPGLLPPSRRRGVNQQILDRLNASGAICISHTRLDGKMTLRFSSARPIRRKNTCSGRGNSSRKRLQG